MSKRISAINLAWRNYKRASVGKNLNFYFPVISEREKTKDKFIIPHAMNNLALTIF